MDPTLAAQVNTMQGQQAQNYQQGQGLYNTDVSNANTYGGQYNADTAQSATDNQNLSDYTNFMQNAGNPLNLYNTGITQGEQAQGFNPQSLATSTQNLTQTENALNNVNNASNSSTGGYGLSGSQLGQYYGSLSQPLQQAAQSQNTAVGNLQQLYQNALTQGQQGASLGFQGEQQVSSNLNQVYQNAQNQAQQAMQQMQFYSQLAQTQGGLNASQQQAYTQAITTIKSAQATINQANAAAGLSTAQTAQINQALAASKAADGSTSAPVASSSTSNTPASNGSSNNYNAAQQSNIVNMNQAPVQGPSFMNRVVGNGENDVSRLIRAI